MDTTYWAALRNQRILWVPHLLRVNMYDTKRSVDMISTGQGLDAGQRSIIWLTTAAPPRVPAAPTPMILGVIPPSPPKNMRTWKIFVETV